MILYVNCCVRQESRTDELAREVLRLLGGDYEEVKLIIKIPVAITATSKTVISCSFFGMSYRQHGSYYEKLEYCIPQEIKMDPKDSYSGFLYYKWKPKKPHKSVTDSTSHTEWLLTYDGEALMDGTKN